MNDVFTFEKLYRAYLDCRETKRKTINALKFEYNLERNIFLLLTELETKKYNPGKSICFVVTEPSPREIFAASFRDRVVHHLLVREVEAMGEKCFIFDSFACRKKKGTHLAVKRLRVLIRKVTKNHSKEAFYLQLDISGFFMAIDHNILYELFEKLIARQNKSAQWKADILWLAKVVIFHKPTSNYVIKGNASLFDLLPPRKSLFHSLAGKGLPIGNYSSQFFANIYLNELDQFVKRELGVTKYIRYVDDFIILDESKEKLKEREREVNLFLNNRLGLTLNLNKTKLYSLNVGVDFLGYFIKPEYVLIRRRVVVNLKDKLQKNYGVSSNIKCDNMDVRTVNNMLATINSYFGHFRHAFSFNLRKDIYDNHLGELKKNFEHDVGYFSLTHVD